ncbi:hypothetical protein A1F99_052020 [Pyrenophora tritici-repentis]|nr:hypothetical protein A1F99_052020 [Pyrenophora tritici-repentis]
MSGWVPYAISGKFIFAFISLTSAWKGKPNVSALHNQNYRYGTQ